MSKPIAPKSSQLGGFIVLISPRRFAERTCASAIFASRVVKRTENARDARKSKRNGKWRCQEGYGENTVVGYCFPLLCFFIIVVVLLVSLIVACERVSLFSIKKETFYVTHVGHIRNGQSCKTILTGWCHPAPWYHSPSPRHVRKQSTSAALRRNHKKKIVTCFYGRTTSCWTGWQTNKMASNPGGGDKGTSWHQSCWNRVLCERAANPWSLMCT